MSEADKAARKARTDAVRAAAAGRRGRETAVIRAAALNVVVGSLGALGFLAICGLGVYEWTQAKSVGGLVYVAVFAAPVFAATNGAQGWLGLGIVRRLFASEGFANRTVVVSLVLAALNGVAAAVTLFGLPSGDYLANAFEGQGMFAVGLSIGTFTLLPLMAIFLNTSAVMALESGDDASDERAAANAT